MPIFTLNCSVQKVSEFTKWIHISCEAWSHSVSVSSDWEAGGQHNNGMWRKEKQCTLLVCVWVYGILQSDRNLCGIFQTKVCLLFHSVAATTLTSCLLCIWELTGSASSFRLKGKRWKFHLVHSPQIPQPSVQSTGGICSTNTTTRSV